ncbi:MAG: translation initiation factor IF-2 [Candidatus Altimarinota bacterium]
MAKTNEVLLIEIAQQCNVSVRDIHFAAKELGYDLAPVAKSVDSKLAKLLIDHFVTLEAKAEKAAKTTKKPKAVSKVQVVKSKPEAPKKEEIKPVIQQTPKKVKASYRIIEKTEPVNKEKPKEVENLIADFLASESKNKKKEEKPFVAEKKKVENHEEKTKKKSFKPTNTEISDELLGLDKSDKPRDTAEMYDQLLEEEREREIVHSQRKQMAGKDANKNSQKRHVQTVSHTLKYDPNRIVEIPDVISVKEFAEKAGLGAAKVIGELMKNGILANINQLMDYDTAAIIAEDLKVKISKKQAAASAEDISAGNLETLVAEHDKSLLKERPPIVVIMGHVDHGKTKLLDAIRSTDVVSKESGGITQHIGAYQVEKNGKRITFLDTPGHEAFTAMRARGARVTDIAILVVAADEGIKPQTLEALQHAKDASVPIIVAINKIDKPNADIERVKGELAGHELIPEDWGGKTIMVPVSAITKKGIDTLLEMILLVAEMENLKANPDRQAVATVIEANLDHSLGPVATVVVNTGTLRLMDNVVIGTSYGRVKVMKDYHGKKVLEAGPSYPVLIAGLSTSAASGDILQVVADEKTARMKALLVKNLREAQQKERGVGEIMSAISAGSLKSLKIVLKADTMGSLEAIKHSLADIKHEDVAVKVILESVGDINESDVMMAAASGAIVMGFHVKSNSNVANLAEKENVEIIHYQIIYKLLDDVKNILTGLLEPEMVETILGEAEVKQIFFSKKKEMVIGCYVETGMMKNKASLRIKRKDEVLGVVNIVSLQKNQDTVDTVKEGSECGIKITGNIKVEAGDKLEAFKIEKKIRTL